MTYFCAKNVGSLRKLERDMTKYTIDMSHGKITSTIGPSYGEGVAIILVVIGSMGLVLSAIIYWFIS